MIIANETRQEIWVKRDIEARSLHHCGRGEARSVTSYDSMCAALFIEHAERMPSLTLSYVACLVLVLVYTFQYYPIKNTIIEKVIKRKYFFNSSTTLA